jgi:hypothetical protein
MFHFDPNELVAVPQNERFGSCCAFSLMVKLMVVPLPKMNAVLVLSKI